MNTSSSDIHPNGTVGVSAFEYPDINLEMLTETCQEEAEPVPETPGPAPSSEVSPEEIRQQLEQETQQRISQARAEGLRAGLEQAKVTFEQELANEQARITAALEEFKKDRVRYYAEVESELVQLALAIAGRILHREAQVDPLLMAGLVKVALQKLEQGSKVTVRVQPEEVEVWEHNISTLANGLQISIIGDASVQPRDCVLETELGTVQLGVEAQLKEVERGFFDLLAHRPE
jgi:flagellar assembly protein FliH